MDLAIGAFVQGFPHFLLHGGVTLVMLIVGVTVHVLMTPMKELQLIREGNSSAGVGLAGVVVGLAIPMSACLASSTSLYDLVIWGAVAILLQMIAFRVADLIMRDLPRRIEKDEMGAAVVLVSVKLAAALVMAAALWDPFLARVQGQWLVDRECGMRIPDWLVYTLVLTVIVVALFYTDNGRPQPELVPPAPQVATPIPPGEPLGPPLPETNPFDERILVQVGEVENGIGTAFAINHSGLWLTARHVVDGCSQVGLSIGNGRMVPVDTMMRSPTSDLALLYTDRAPKTVSVDFGKEMRVGEPGYHVGFPQGESGEVASRLLARSRLVTRGRYALEEGVLAWAETARSDQLRGTLAGMSGGPVFDANGAVVGVTVAESPRRGRIYTAAPSSVIRFLNDHSAVAVSGETVPLAPGSYGREADRLRSERAIVKVVCRVDPW